MTSSTSPPDPDAAATVADAHRTIREILGRLEDECSVAQARQLVETLHAISVEHFAEEEQPGGLYSQLRAQRPTFDPKLRGLEHEHRELLAGMEDLADRYAALAEATRDLRARTVELVQRISLHERTETRMTMDAFLVDLGGGD